MIYEIALKFHPYHKNPARPSGLGVYRVMACLYAAPGPLINVVHGEEFFDGEKLPFLILRTERAYKVRSRVDPRRVLGI